MPTEQQRTVATDNRSIELAFRVSTRRSRALAETDAESLGVGGWVRWFLGENASSATAAAARAQYTKDIIGAVVAALADQGVEVLATVCHLNRTRAALYRGAGQRVCCVLLRARARLPSELSFPEQAVVVNGTHPDYNVTVATSGARAATELLVLEPLRTASLSST